MKLEIEIEVDISGDIVRGSPSRFDRWNGQWLPGEAPDVKNCVITFRGIDITKALTVKEIEHLKNQYIEEHLEDVG